jgi:hypothetical protein
LLAFFFPVGRKIMVSLGRALASGAHPRRIYIFKSGGTTKKTEPKRVLSFLCLMVTFDAGFF